MITEELLERNLKRKIIHVDMDCFYAAVELLDRPELKDKPVAVGGNPNGRGIICTSNYVARKYGVRSAMSSFAALKLCPNLIFLPLNFYKYKAASTKIREIFADYTDKVEPLSLDEAYLDVTVSDKCFGSATLIAQEIKQRIYEETGLTASAGVSVNKMLAKVASEWKKPNGFFVIKPGDINNFMPSLPFNKINGVGKVTMERLKEDKVFLCKDVYSYSLSYLTTKYGKLGSFLYYRSRGIHLGEVGAKSSSKSLSSERTFLSLENSDPDFLLTKKKVFGALSDRVNRNLSEKDIDDIHKIFVKVKFSDFQVRTLECILPANAITWFHELIVEEDSQDLFTFYEDLIDQILGQSPGQSFRLLGMGIRFKDNGQEAGQLDLFKHFDKAS